GLEETYCSMKIK
nr:RecName: Full=Globulin 1; AltName: Full=11S globulin seed storage protein 1; Contains: RecName: Full=Globulin 1 basic chain [Elaeis guineensis]